MHPCIAGVTHVPALSFCLRDSGFTGEIPLHLRRPIEWDSPELCPYTVSCSSERLIVFSFGRVPFQLSFFSVHHPQICMRFDSMSLPGICGIYKGTWPEVYKRIDGFPFLKGRAPTRERVLGVSPGGPGLRFRRWMDAQALSQALYHTARRKGKWGNLLAWQI